jgi:hypothetical protein
MVFYPTPVNSGTNIVSSLTDGYTISVSWWQAYPTIGTNKIAYNIYYSTIKENTFSDGPKYASVDGSLIANIIDLVPGQLYFIAVRPVEYNPLQFNLALYLTPAYDNLRLYPTSLLSQDILAIDLIIPLIDSYGFPNSGIIKIGYEEVQYSSIIGNNLIIPAVGVNVPAGLIDQGGGNYFTALGTNVGQGSLYGLMAVGGLNTETWTIRCIDGYTSSFIAIGSVSMTKIDGYSNPYIWQSNGPTISNGILSFRIIETTPFITGDEFIVKIGGPTVGVANGRGYNVTIARDHSVGGFDGYHYLDPIISLYVTGEDQTYDNIIACQSRFEYPNFPFTMVDGYHQVMKDLLSTDLTVSDTANADFPMYDYAGYHRIDPVLLLSGECVGLYMGGQQGCIDQYGNYNIVRGLNLQQRNLQRQEVDLSVVGRPAVLIKRVQTGITCACYLANSEHQDDRCTFCLGSKFVMGYEQYFNPRRSDGRIMVKVNPADEQTKQYDSGLESELPIGLWTLTIPTIKTRDIIILFDLAGEEEFRYEVATVSRNNTILGQEGGQLIKAARIRKFDPAYQIRTFDDTSMFPYDIITGIGMAIPGIPPHTHSVRANETDPSKWSQMTGVSQGHNHMLIVEGGNLTVLPALGHTHKIL